MNTLLLMPGELLITRADFKLSFAQIWQGKWQLLHAFEPRASWPMPNNFEALIPAGTLVELLSYKVRRAPNPRYSSVSMLVKDSPEKRLLPKSRGGTGRRVVLHIPPTVFKEMDIERVGNLPI